MMEQKPLTPQDVLNMPLSVFVQMFGWRPVDALEKKWFAVTGKRLNAEMRGALHAMGEDRDGLENVNMSE